MTLTIDIPTKLIERAAELGMPIESFIQQALDELSQEPVPDGFKRLGTPNMSLEEAGATIRSIQQTHTLGGHNIKDLIDEGRRI